VDEVAPLDYRRERINSLDFNETKKTNYKDNLVEIDLIVERIH